MFSPDSWSTILLVTEVFRAKPGNLDRREKGPVIKPKTERKTADRQAVILLID